MKTKLTLRLLDKYQSPTKEVEAIEIENAPIPQIGTTIHFESHSKPVQDVNWHFDQMQDNCLVVVVNCW